MGFLGASYPEDVGGSGGDWWYTAVWGEELVRSGCAGVNMALAVQSTMATPIINEIGTREQKDEFLVPALTRRQDRRARRQRAQLRLRRGVDPHHRAQGRRRLRHQRREVLDHQRHARRLHHAGGAHRRRGLRRHLARALPDRRQGLQGHAQDPQGRQPRLRHRRALVRGLPHPARATSSARRTRASTTS